MYRKFHNPERRKLQFALCTNVSVEVVGKCFLLLLVLFVSFTYKQDDIRKSASEPRPLNFMQWAERGNEVWLTAYITVSLTVHPHSMLKGLSCFHIRNNISRGKKKTKHIPLHTLQLYHPFPGACFVFKKNDNGNTSGGRQSTSNSHSSL